MFVGQSNCWQCRTQMGGGASPADPLFFLFHSFLDYIRLMRTDCWEFDQVPLDKVEDYSPYSWSVNSQYPDLSMDDAMEWEHICTAANVDVFCADNEVTIRSLWDMTRWGVSYELGSFWTDNDRLQRLCSGKINGSWFYSADEVQQNRLSVGTHAENGNTGTPSTRWVVWSAFIMLPICVWLTLCHRTRPKKVGDERGKYGAVTQH